MANKAYKYDDLSNLIYADFAWRRKELNVFKNKIPESKNSAQKPLIRSGITMLYAHWEGFIKNLMYFYLQYISYRSLKNKEILPQLYALCIKKKINIADSMKSITELINYIVDELESTAKIPYKNIIDTKSNLWFATLDDIFFTVGLDVSEVKHKRSVIDDLVELRNHIAHGENSLIDKETFDLFYSEIIEVMEHIKTIIENSAINEVFKKRINY